WFVVPAMAETTTATSWPASTSRFTWAATTRMRSTFATEVPPNFMTSLAIAYPTLPSPAPRLETGTLDQTGPYVVIWRPHDDRMTDGPARPGAAIHTGPGAEPQQARNRAQRIKDAGKPSYNDRHDRHAARQKKYGKRRSRGDRPLFRHGCRVVGPKWQVPPPPQVQPDPPCLYPRARLC